MSELEPTTDVVTLAEHVDGLGQSVARRLDDHGVETVADILIADEGALTDVPYVSELRADLLRETADAIVDVEPREVDFDATESVVSEAAIPLSVRRGEEVLIGGARSEVYHTRDCSVVRSHDIDRTTAKDAAVRSGHSECDACQDPGIYINTGRRGRVESELEPLVDSREVLLEATLGEKLNVTMAARKGYADPWAVIEVEEATEWETAVGDNWGTRRLRISQRPTAEDHHKECDLVLGAGIRIEDPPGKHTSSQPNPKSWSVESVGAVGRVSQSTYYQLVGQQQEHEENRPEGDDTWRRYHHRGETA